MEIEDEVDLLMSTDILAAQISTKSINFARAQSGWIFREDKKVIILSFKPINCIVDNIFCYERN